MAIRLLKWLILIIITNGLLFSEENWGAYTGSSGDYTKKILTIGMQFNFIHFQVMQKINNRNVLVFLNDVQSNDWYFKTLYEKLGNEISLFEYKTGSKIFANIPPFESRRLKFYFQERKILAQWPPFYPEIKEIQRELETGNFKSKYLLLSGEQSNLLLQSKIYENYDRLILVSPAPNTIQVDPLIIKIKKILWVGSTFEKEKLSVLREKFGGEILTYSRSSSGRDLLMRNGKTLDDILAWLQN